MVVTSRVVVAPLCRGERNQYRHNHGKRGRRFIGICDKNVKGKYVRLYST